MFSILTLTLKLDWLVPSGESGGKNIIGQLNRAHSHSHTHSDHRRSLSDSDGGRIVSKGRKTKTDFFSFITVERIA
ncbi:hypothetical protein ABHV44_03105 [Flavobacteriales bacterium DA487]